MPLLRSTLKNYIQKLKATSIRTAERDALTLLAFGLDLSTTDVLLNQDKFISDKDLLKLNELINRRAMHEPVSKILKKRLFWDSIFYIDKTVLDPRPETELLVQSVIENLGQSNHILDLGTGSGCIAISLASTFNQVRVIGSDISNSALKIAKKNAKLNNAKVTFIQSDWFKNIDIKFDIIVSNPPYISQDDFLNLPDDVRNFDPKVALFGGADGLDCYRKIAFSISPYLNTGGRGFFEIGLGQKTDVVSLFQACGLSIFDIKYDLNGVERVVCVKKDA